MPTILHLETSNTVCSVCISRDREVLALRENTEGNQHASLLTPFIEQVMAEASLTYSQLDALCLSMGPGSYTGLRIGASAAKAICYASGKPLIGVSTLQAMVAGYISKHGEQDNGTVFCPMIDARRLEVYAALYNSRLENLKEPKPWIINEEDFLTGYERVPQVICFGNGAAKAAPILNYGNLKFDGSTYISALNLIDLAHKGFDLGQFIDIAYFDPYYLKTTTFIPTKGA